ncbi:MAG: TIR domain-containing protein [Opitutae bacterium]|nr:TIR domain-containing protein [Opitutae bacterium]
MSDSSKAVFLSYASQDAEAAKRICDALRQAGIEVWFDQSELVGGDAWDAKIRKQIKECALFVPVISANTQARREGYFRIEWKLAAQRTHAFADGTPFLLPAVIDATRDGEALVPEEFRAVQWTRLPGGETSAAFAARVGKLLGGGASSRETGLPSAARELGPPGRTRRRRPWLVPAVTGLVAAAVVAVWQPWKKAEPVPATGRPAEGAKPAAPLSEARKLAEQARVLLVKPGGAASKFDTAALLCERALALDPVEAEVWAVASQIDTRMWFHGFDRTERRSESARSKAARALNLAPASFEARLAHATFLVLVAGRPLADQAEPVLRALRQENPREFRVLDILGQLLAAQGKLEESVACSEEAARLPDGAATALMQKAWTLTGFRRIAEADAALDQSIAVQPISGNITLRVFLDLGWHGDPDRALAALRKLPADEMAEDNGISAVVRLHRWRREPAELLNFLNTVPRDWLTWGVTGPKAAVTGDANAELGRLAAAREDWRQALTLVEQRLAGTPNDRGLLEWKACLLASLGERAKARETYQRSLEAPSGRGALLNIEKLDRLLSPEELCDELERRTQGAVEGMERGERPATRFVSAADLRLNPAWDGVRSLPRFQALQARLDADPRFNPKAGARPAAAAPKADEKSVAVLAFANLSDDKANEYFSDGISEELLTVLQKIPGLHVAARTSAFSFKGKNATAQEIGEKLGVATLVEGSVQKSGRRVKVTARLSRVATGEELWSRSYTRELKDAFALQEELATAIVGELSAQLPGGPSVATRVKAAVRGGTTNPEAHQFFLQGRYIQARFSMDNMINAIGCFERATALDPEFALAWAALSRAHAMHVGWSDRMTRAEFDAELAQARRAADRALALEPDMPEALNARFEVQFNYDFDWRGGAELMQRALALAPSDPVLMSAASRVAGVYGHGDRAVELLRQAVALDPVNAELRVYLALALVQARRWAAARAEFARVAALSPTTPWAYAGSGLTYLYEGRYAEALATLEHEATEFARQVVSAVALWGLHREAESDAVLDQMIKVNGDVGAYQIAEIYGFRGDKDRAFAWLERAHRQRDAGFVVFTQDPFFDSLKDDPRWTEFRRKLAFPVKN